MIGEDKSYWSVIARKRVSRRRAIGAGAAGLAVAGAAVTVGCGDDDEKASQSPNAAGVAQKPKYGGIIRTSVNTDAPHLDIHQFSSTALFRYIGQAYSRLLRLKVGPDVPKGASVLASELAESWEQVDDLTYNFKLRPNVKFHNVAPVNGRALVAEDVIYSFGRQRDLKLNADNLPDIDQMRAVDSRTIQIKTKGVDVDFQLAIAGYTNKVIAREVVERYGDLKQAPVIGTGAWIMQEWVPNNVRRMKRNPEYFLKDAEGNQLPYADGVEETVIADPALNLAAFRTGQVMIYGVGQSGGAIPPELEALKRQIRGLTVIEEERQLNPYVIMARVDRPTTNDPRVRQALFNKALNRQVLIDTVRFGYGTWSTGLTLPSADWELPQEEIKKLIGYDLAGARALLQQAGFTGWNPKKKFFALGTEGTAVGEILQQQLQAVNVNSTLEACDATCIQAVYAGRTDFELLSGPNASGGLPTAGLRQRFVTGGGRNVTRMNDAQLDSLINSQVKERNEARRRDLWLQIQRRLIEVAAMVPLYGSVSVTGIHPVLKNYAGPPNQYEFSGPETWWIDQ